VAVAVAVASNPNLEADSGALRCRDGSFEHGPDVAHQTEQRRARAVRPRCLAVLVVEKVVAEGRFELPTKGL